MKCHEHLMSIANIFPALDRRNELLSALADRMRDVEEKASTLERELEQAKEDRARAAMDARNPLLKHLAALEAEAKQAKDDEAWALRNAVPIHRRQDAWLAEHFDGHRRLDAEATTIHAALSALREKVEGGSR